MNERFSQILVVGLGVLIGWYFFKQPTERDYQEFPEEREAIQKHLNEQLDGSGFTPASDSNIVVEPISDLNIEKNLVIEKRLELENKITVSKKLELTDKQDYGKALELEEKLDLVTGIDPGLQLELEKGLELEKKLALNKELKFEKDLELEKELKLEK